MDTLNELIRYCEEPEPVGALLLTGEWGCGKTYLIEHSLKEKLHNTHIIVRISLFGIDSVNIFHANVKSQWILSCGGFFSTFETNKKAIEYSINLIEKGLSKLLPEEMSDIPKTLFSVNFSDFISIKNHITRADKELKVILVFDDLERSNLSDTELLGCINEYSENQRFHVIVISDEDKMIEKNNQEKTDKKQFTYNEIKEKVIARTVRYKPDFSAIITSIIEKRDWGYGDYKQYLINKKQLVLFVFQTNDNDKYYHNKNKKPNNLRILKTTLQDFGWIYQRFAKESVQKVDKYFISFIIYSLVIKSGNTKIEPGKEYDFEQNIAKIYPGYDYRFLLNSCRIWIRDGDWNEDLFEEELLEVVENDKEDDPEYMIRNFSVVLIEDDDLPELFAGLLSDCYSGNLTLKRYIQFIRNAVVLRENDSPLYSEINWDKVREGVEKRFVIDIKANEENSLYTHFYHDSEDCEKYKNNELKIYNLIKNFCVSNRVSFDNTEKQFVEEINLNGFFSAIRLNKYHDRFSYDMEYAIYNSFVHSTQEEKSAFGRYFLYFWKSVEIKSEERKKDAIANLKTLISDLENFHSELEKKGKIFSAKHTKQFCDSVDEILITSQNNNVLSERDV